METNQTAVTVYRRQSWLLPYYYRLFEIRDAFAAAQNNNTSAH